MLGSDIVGMSLLVDFVRRAWQVVDGGGAGRDGAGTHRCAISFVLNTIGSYRYLPSQSDSTGFILAISFEICNFLPQ